MIWWKFKKNCTWSIDLYKSILGAQNIKLSIQEINTNTKEHKIVNKYLTGSNLEYFVPYIPKSLIKKYNKHVNLYLIDPNIAKTIASIIIKELFKKKCIVECNPGIGLLTQELLNYNIPLINLYESAQVFLQNQSPLMKLLSKYDERLVLNELNFKNVWLKLLKDNYTNKNESNIYFKHLQIIAWKKKRYLQNINCKKKKYLQIIVAIPNKDFIMLLVHNFCNQACIFEDFNLVFYVTVSSFTWRCLTTTNKDISNEQHYTHFNVIINLFFNIKYLGEVSRTAFLPFSNKMFYGKIDELTTSMYVIKLKPKQKMDSILLKKDLLGFWFFLKFCLRSKKNKVITVFEKFVPGCGIRLIELDININSTFKELSPKELLNIFKYFRTWPEYDLKLFSSQLLDHDDEEEIEVINETKIADTNN